MLKRSADNILFDKGERKIKNITILQIIFDVILIALFGYSGLTGESIDLFVALLWCLCLWLNVYEHNSL